jgi:putative transposase
VSALLELAPHVGLKPACEALGVPRASIYRCRQRALRRRVPRPKPSRALSAVERQRVLAVLHQERFVDKAPAEIAAILLDEGVYHCSVRTMYRVLHDNREVRERRNQRRHPTYVRPEHLATGPNQVWSWDITKLRGPGKGIYFNLYVVLDIYSRYVVGWLVAERESGDIAEELIRATCEKEQIGRDQLTIHSDRGSPMKSQPVGYLYAELGITRTFSRPQVSNDNPYSESQFKTLKYRPEFPDRFGSVQHARSFGRRFFSWYNTEHRHSGIAMLTPEDVHRGRAARVLEHRREVLERAYAAHPERFVRKPPEPPPLPDQVWINRPEEAAIEVTAQ